MRRRAGRIGKVLCSPFSDDLLDLILCGNGCRIGSGKEWLKVQDETRQEEEGVGVVVLCCVYLLICELLTMA